MWSLAENGVHNISKQIEPSSGIKINSKHYQSFENKTLYNNNTCLHFTMLKRI